jgi:hypothetical protein
MTSNIKLGNINTAFPIAGRDNDSQGFRDNFSNILNNFETTASEITQLQTTSVVWNSTANITTTFQNSVRLVGAQTKQFTESVNTNVTINGTNVTLDYTTGDLQVINPTSSVSLAFAPTWPTASSFGAVFAKMRLKINVTDVLHTISFTTANFIGLSGITGMSGNTWTPPSIGIYYFEISTYTGGVDLAVEQCISPVSSASGNVSIINSSLLETSSHISSIRNVTTIDCTNGNIQYFTLNENTALTFINWSTTINVYSKVRVAIRAEAVYSILFPFSVSVGLNKITSGSLVGQELTPALGTYLLEFSSYDNGSSIFVIPLIQP